jgi:hypothetical protein
MCSQATTLQGDRVTHRGEAEAEAETGAETERLAYYLLAGLGYAGLAGLLLLLPVAAGCWLVAAGAVAVLLLLLLLLFPVAVFMLTINTTNVLGCVHQRGPKGFNHRTGGTGRVHQSLGTCVPSLLATGFALSLFLFLFGLFSSLFCLFFGFSSRFFLSVVSPLPLFVSLVLSFVSLSVSLFSLLFVSLFLSLLSVLLSLVLFAAAGHLPDHTAVSSPQRHCHPIQLASDGHACGEDALHASCELHLGCFEVPITSQRWVRMWSRCAARLPRAAPGLF